MTDPTVLTIILNYRTPELTLRACAAALREMQGIAGEILVIDNGSGDDSHQVLSEAAERNGWTGTAGLRLLRNDRNGGFGAGVNSGLRAKLSDGTAPDFYYLLNSDAWPEPGAIRKLRNFLITNRKAGMAGSYIEGVDGVPHQTAFRFPTVAGEFERAVHTGLVTRLLRHAVVPLAIPEQERQVDWTAGASLMIRRRMLEQTGGFDETFFLYFEETDLCRRARDAGWTTHYLPDSKVIHVGSASTGMKTWSRVPDYWFDSRLHYFTKTHGRAYAAAATGALIAGGAIWQLRRVLQRRAQVDPDWFLWDLIRHSCRALLRRTGPRVATGVAVPVLEDSK